MSANLDLRSTHNHYKRSYESSIISTCAWYATAGVARRKCSRVGAQASLRRECHLARCRDAQRGDSDMGASRSLAEIWKPLRAGTPCSACRHVVVGGRVRSMCVLTWLEVSRCPAGLLSAGLRWTSCLPMGRRFRCRGAAGLGAMGHGNLVCIWGTSFCQVSQFKIAGGFPDYLRFRGTAVAASCASRAQACDARGCLTMGVVALSF